MEKKLIGKGGSACVYKSGNYAIKEYNKDKRFYADLEHFIKESFIISYLDHPHIITIKDYNVNKLQLMMDYYPQNLGERLRKNRNFKHVKTIMNQLLSAINYLHNTGIIHSDIKLENILVKNNNIVLCDFNSSIIMSQPFDDWNITTKTYRAPEITARESVGPEIDIYSSAVVFAHLICRDNSPDKTCIEEAFDKSRPCQKDLLKKMLMSYKKRISAYNALKHPYFSRMRIIRGREKHGACPLLSKFYLERRQKYVSRYNQYAKIDDWTIEHSALAMKIVDMTSSEHISYSKYLTAAAYFISLCMLTYHSKVSIRQFIDDFNIKNIAPFILVIKQILSVIFPYLPVKLTKKFKNYRKCWK